MREEKQSNEQQTRPSWNSVHGQYSQSRQGRALNAVVTPEDITHFHLHSWLANDFTSNLKVYSTKVGYEFEGVLLLNKD